jgi:uroporphyrinogen decarboxylase
MNSRERCELSLNHHEPDRAPIFASYVPEVEQELRQYSNTDKLDLGVSLGNDMVKDCVGLELSFNGEPYPEYTDEWGIKWRYAENEFCRFTEIVQSPLSGDESKLDVYQIPDPGIETRYDRFRELKKLYGKEKWLIGSSQISIFEASWYLRGLDQFMMDMAVSPDYAEALMDKVMQWPLEAGKMYAKLGADMIWFGDDVAMQTGMMISVQMWRKFLKPRYAELFSAVKKINPQIKTAYHSCGNCWDILDDMVEIGLDVLNPLQPMAINPFEVKKRFGKKLALFGGLCVQNLLPNGTPAEIATQVQKLKTQCGRDGGYILSPAHHIQADTSVENIMAFYKEALRTDK